MIDWMKYAEIQTLKRKGFKKARVTKMLHINRETVAKYWEKPPDVFETERTRSDHRMADEISGYDRGSDI